MIRGNIPGRNIPYYCKSCDQAGKKIFMNDTKNSCLTCPSCGRIVPRPKRSAILRSADPVRFRTRGVGTKQNQQTSSWDGIIDSYQSPPVSQKLKIEAEIFNTSDEYQIIINLPYHKSIKDITCEIKGTTLVVQSAVIDYKEEFSLPEDVKELKKIFKNGILTLHFKKG